MAKLGNNIIVGRLGGSDFAGAKSCDIQTDVEMIETSSPNSGTWRYYLAGRKQWSVTLNYMVTNMSDLLTAGSQYRLKIYDRNVSSNYVTGTALLKTCKIVAQRGSLITGTFQFIGSGPLV